MGKSIETSIIQPEYRRDIDGLRAIAVLVVIIFHIGFLPNGYLGVDIFFVISGYLIAKILYKEAKEGRFSLIQFYIRRIRRIIPLVVFCSLVSLLIGIFVMLPDDLENLSQSIVATSLMANNVLLLITTGNYWDISNDYKPLMHTWSLGIEEQFYFILPLIILFFKKKNVKYIFFSLCLLAFISAIVFLVPSIGSSASKFYLIQYRFFELAIGGIAGIALGNKKLKFNGGWLVLFLLIFLLLVDVKVNPNFLLVIAVGLATLFMITERSKVEKLILENSLVQYIGKISFSLYMWHQIIFAFSRYSVFNDIKMFPNYLYAVLFTFIMSVLSYHFIETPFRDKKRIATKNALLTVFFLTALLLLSSFYIIKKKGIIRDVPELSMYTSKMYSGNIHIDYNEKVYKMNAPFTNNERKKYWLLETVLREIG